MTNAAALSLPVWWPSPDLLIRQRIRLKKLVQTVAKTNNGMSRTPQLELTDICLQKLASPQASSRVVEHPV